MNLIKNRYEFLIATVLLMCFSCRTEISLPAFSADGERRVVTAIVPTDSEYEFWTLHTDKANLGDYTNECLIKKANKFVTANGNIRYVISKKGLTKISSNGKPNKIYEFLSGEEASDILNKAKQLMNAFEMQYNLDYTEQKQIIDKLVGVIENGN